MESKVTSSDVNMLNPRRTGSPTAASEPSSGVIFDKHDLYYDMTGKKLIIIFNHRTFKKSLYFNYSRPAERTGTERDVESLNETFQRFGFKANVYSDLTYSQIMDVMSQLSEQDHRDTSCIAIAIMTHGDTGVVYAADRPYELGDLFRCLQNHPGLVGKPKLLFVQACRGGLLDSGKQVQYDGRENIVLPTHADTLIVYSSSEKYVAFRDSDGSWLMQALCRMINEYHQSFDLLQILTLVHRAVAYTTSYSPKDRNLDNKKQMPETKFTLTKLLKFREV